jgi:FAD/FMN-containing dehydrogenase
MQQLFKYLEQEKIGVKIITPESPAYQYYTNPERGEKSEPSFILKPFDEAELQKVILALNKFKVSAVIFAGNTGLVSAQCAKNQALIDLNFLDNLTKIIFSDGRFFEFCKNPQEFSNAKKAQIWQDEFYNFIKNNNLTKKDFIGATIDCQAGCSVGTINFVLSVANIELPIDTGAVYFGAGMSAGGGAANASHGTYGLLHGKQSDLVLELNAINGDGSLRNEVFDANKPITIYEDKTIINSAKAQYGDSALATQGTFAVITNLKFKTALIPNQQHYFLVQIDSIKQANELRKNLHKQFPNNLRQFEIMSQFATELVRKFEPDNFINPFDNNQKYSSNYILMIEGISADFISTEGEDIGILFFEYLTKNLAIDSEKIAYAGINGDNTIGNLDAFKKLRHSISGASTKYANQLGKHSGGANFHRITPDISTPLNNISAFVDELQRFLEANNFELNIFGHIGIGSLHIHIYAPQNMPLDKNAKLQLTEKVFEITKKYNGSCWSEHGIGTANAKLYEKFTQKDFVDEWLGYKKKYDPNNILNPNSNDFAKYY